MFIRTVSAVVLAASTFAPVAMHASMFGHADKGTTTTTAPTKGKMVKMTLKNRTTEPMALMVGDQPVTIAANGEYELKAVEGTKVMGSDNTVKVTVTRDLDGTTCSFR